MTKYEEKISKINKYKAWKYFETKYPCLKMIRSISKYSIVLHHKDPSWRKEDVSRYIQWNPLDLEVMSRSDHQSLHFKNRKYTESERKSHTHLWVVYNGETISLKDSCKKSGIYYTSVLHRIRNKKQSHQDAFDAILFGRKRKPRN